MYSFYIYINLATMHLSNEPVTPISNMRAIIKFDVKQQMIDEYNIGWITNCHR